MKAFADDIDLIKRIEDGSRPAFEELVRKYQDKIYNLCCYMLHDPDTARDAAQETFLKAYSRLKDFRGECAFYSWLYRIAVNTCLDEKRKSHEVTDSMETTPAVEDIPSSGPSAERLYQSKETGRAIQAALQKLPDGLRAAIVLKEMEGLSYEEIGDTLAISVGTVKSRISRAREELRRLLGGRI
jgi:RNA polymerase sigma-70 factor (ECF subfamily)